MSRASQQRPYLMKHSLLESWIPMYQATTDASMLWGSSSLMGRPHVGVPVDNPNWAQPLNHPIPGTRYVSEKPPADFRPALQSPEGTWVFSPNIMEQRNYLPVSCPNSWPMESKTLIKWLLLYTSHIFGMIHYAAKANWSHRLLIIVGDKYEAGKC